MKNEQPSPYQLAVLSELGISYWQMQDSIEPEQVETVPTKASESTAPESIAPESITTESIETRPHDKINAFGCVVVVGFEQTEPKNIWFKDLAIALSLADDQIIWAPPGKNANDYQDFLCVASKSEEFSVDWPLINIAESASNANAHKEIWQRLLRE